MTYPLAVQLVLAAAPTTSNQPGGQGQEFGSSGPVALILIIVLFIAVAFLIRSMTKHLKRVPASFDPPDTDADEPTKQP
jgi:hypothetical protein